MTPTTPRKLSSSILRFIKNIGLDEKPIFLYYTNRSDKYNNNECLTNGEVESAKTGSKVIYGWIIWEDRKNNFIEAIFHSVLTEGRRTIDITPRVDGEKKIMFVHDKNRKAIRHDKHTWKTWSPFKSFRGVIINTSDCCMNRNQSYFDQ